ncbi:hypothetical protein FANTH_6807 [Fusarium anthophilum]|uniref:Uncharacterized protein n=1 Tax=Fusarium anthophilum TaxID=48485 RepID=A0A8H4ZHW5_9HYPO|nr:hypothetical protein FANTH_6807 [Fusarium anthophilum]
MSSSKNKPPELYKPLEGYSFYLIDQVKGKYEGKIRKNCGTIRKSWTPQTANVVCSKAEYNSFRRRIAGDVGDKVELPDKDFIAIERAYRDSAKYVVNTGCLDALGDNSHVWRRIDWADLYENKEPETRFDFFIQEMQTHGVQRLSSLLDEAIEVSSEDNMKAKSYDREYTRIANVIKDCPNELAILNNLRDKHDDAIALIRDVRKVAGTLVQDESHESAE